MPELYILSIDAPDDYVATIHRTREVAEAALRRWAFDNEADLDEADECLRDHGVELIEYLQDHGGIETNITRTTLPWPLVVVERELVERAKVALDWPVPHLRDQSTADIIRDLANSQEV